MSTPTNYAADESNLRRQKLLADAFAPTTHSLLDDLSVPSGAEVLDVGCGIGRTTRLLQERLPGPKHVVGLDADADLLDVARDRTEDTENERAADVTYREGDAADLPFDSDRFDVVFTRFLLTHLPAGRHRGSTGARLRVVRDLAHELSLPDGP